MAARLRPQHQTEIRDKIRASQLVNYLEKHALTGEGSEYAKTRVVAAVALLKKCVPDLSSNEHYGEIDGKLEITHKIA
jgi:hypothetical protein